MLAVGSSVDNNFAETELKPLHHISNIEKPCNFILHLLQK